LFVEKILKLKVLFKTLEGDSDVKRTAGKILVKCCELDIFNLIIDNENFFKDRLKNIIDNSERFALRFSICEKAALVSSTHIFDSLVDEKCNPVRCHSFLMYTIYAGDNNRTLSLIEKHKIDVTDSDYLFSTYACWLKNTELQKFSEKKQEEKNKLKEEKRKTLLSKNVETSGYLGNQKKEEDSPSIIMNELFEYIKKNNPLLLKKIKSKNPSVVLKKFDEIFLKDNQFSNQIKNEN
jgi:hypothetical protein